MLRLLGRGLKAWGCGHVPCFGQIGSCLSGLLVDWAELWLVNNFVYTNWGKIQPLKNMLTILDFGSFLKITKIEDKSSAHTVGMFSMRPNPPKRHIQQHFIKSTILLIKLKIP